MKPKGIALIKSTIKMEDCIVGGIMSEEQFYNQIRNKFVSVQDIAVNKSGCLILINNPCALVDVPRKYISCVYPFYKDTDGYLICTEFNEIEILQWKAILYTECPSKDPLIQISLFFSNYPSFWERELKGEFNWE